MTDIFPKDKYNETLLANVSPVNWVNPQPAPLYDLVVIGAGTAGLVTAAGAAGLGAKAALVEKHLMGGDCLNYGCVPSKSLIRSARAFADGRDAHEYGVEVSDGSHVNFAAVMERMRRLRSQISPHDSAERFSQLGVDVFLGSAHLKGPDTVEVDGSDFRFKKGIISTGARAAIPPIEGLSECGYLTNETVFSLTECPKRLAVLGGGPLGSELAQAFSRLGSQVTLIERSSQLLPRDDSDAAQIVLGSFQKDGIHVCLNATAKRVKVCEQGKEITVLTGDQEEIITVDEILVSTGRLPNVEGLNLEAAGVHFDPKKGVRVNDYLQTSNARIFAAGDVCMKYKFTHAADAAARVVIQNALFPFKKKMKTLTIPWCTYTDPEVAHIGMQEQEALDSGFDVDTYIESFKEVDRAVTDGEENGFVKIITRKGTGKILGATIVARQAGEMINEISLAMVSNLNLGTLAQVIHPYPTQSEAIKHIADAFNKTRLTPFRKKILTWLMNLSR